jgi:acyl transferase domain-containing protein
MTVDDALRKAAAEIRRLRARVAELEAGTDDELAVLGMACRFPGGCTDPARFWDLIAAGADAITPLPAQRWHGPQTGWAGTVGGVDEFDPGFFGLTDAQARLMDPQQRLVLECAWEALEHAGIPITTAASLRTGVFLGVAHQDYLFAALDAGAAPSAYLGLGNARSIIPNRVSYHLGLTGPSIAVDTACSSSLVALHLAAQSLRAGECDLVLAGGVNLITAGISTDLTDAVLPLAPDGVLRAFDADAAGMVRGEGAGIVVLSRLRDAQARNDPILARVLATACDSDGASNGLTAPNPRAQTALLRTALAKAGVPASDIGYVEMHATGTPLGDPIEFDAIAEAYRDGPRCFLGSVKANIGHLEAAAGIASFIKAVECVRRGQIPPQPHVRRLNPHIGLTGTRFAIPDRQVDWPGPRVAGVSSFGFGGTNAHALIAEPPPSPPTTGGGLMILPLSARSASALAELTDAYWTLLAEPDMTEQRAWAIAAATARGRNAHPVRLAVVGRTVAELVAGLGVAAKGTVAGIAVEPALRWVAGESPDWSDFYPGPRPSAELPTYPWQRKRLWFEPPTGRAPQKLLDFLVAGIAELLELDDPADVDVHQPARDIDLESMAFVELKTRVEKEFGVSVPLADLMDGASLVAIADHIAGTAS